MNFEQRNGKDMILIDGMPASVLEGQEHTRQPWEE